MRLDGKVAIVTGGSRGIGRAICMGLGEAGASVVVASRTEEDRSAGTEYEKYGSGDIRATAAQITAEGGKALPVRCDVSQVQDIQNLMAATLDHFGRIDVLVCNAVYGLRVARGGSGRGALGPMPGRERARSAAALQVRSTGYDLPGETEDPYTA